MYRLSTLNTPFGKEKQLGIENIYHVLANHTFVWKSVQARSLELVRVVLFCTELLSWKLPLGDIRSTTSQTRVYNMSETQRTWNSSGRLDYALPKC